MAESADSFGPAKSYEITFLYRDRPRFDGAALVERLSRDLRTDLISSSDDIIGVGHPDHRVQLEDGNVPTWTQIVRFKKAWQASEFAGALEQTWDWDESEKVVRRCKHRVLMGDVIGSGLPYRDRLSIITRVALAWNELTKPNAVFWEVAGCIIDPSRLERRLSFGCNVRLFNVEGEEDRVLMDTLGLAALGLPDVQIDFKGLEASEVARWLYTRATRILDKGAPGTGKVEGIKPDDQWIWANSLSAIQPRRPVMDVDAGQYSAHWSARSN